MELESWLLLALGLPFISALLSPLLERLRPRSASLIASATGAASFLILLVVWMVGGDSVIQYPWIPSVGISFVLRLDALTLIFSALITGVGSLILIYSHSYMADEAGTSRFYTYMSLFMGSMLGLVLAGDLILLFIFWELTTLISFLLIGYRREDGRSVAAALKALLITSLGGLALLVSFILMSSVVGSFNLEAALQSGDALQAGGLLLPTLTLFAVAVAAKSAQFPLHVWLPDAMVAPTPVSAYLHSAAMVNAGIYLLARFLPTMVSGGWELIFIPLGTATMILGGLQAIRSVDLKKILAYSTVSQLGLLTSAFGIATLTGQAAGLFQLLNHALMKSALFLVAGTVILGTGLTNIRELGGLRRRMPVTAVACGLAALSMAGLPPLGGFLSKEVFYEAALESGLIWAPFLAVIGGGLTFAYSLYFFSRIFLGKGGGEGAKEPLSLAIPALALAVLTLLLGLLPSLATGLISTSVLSGEGAFAPNLFSGSINTLAMSLVSALIGVSILWRYEAVASFLNRSLVSLGRVTADAVYEGFIGASRRFSRALGLLVQNGSVRRYTGILILFVLLALLWPLPRPTLELPVLQSTKDVVLAIILAAMMVFAVLAASLRRTLYAILSLSGMGFLLAMTFMLLNAPDLAMTQILVEMVLLVIFLMVLHKIPFRAIQPSKRRGLVDALLAIGMVGAVASLVALSLSAFLLPSVATYFLEIPVELTGGRNVVNVIVTDFRAFDTLGEITVIGLASLAVYTLLRRWKPD
ncbi:MAG: hydrogen gas-evolving membrane-bound hydrogenase subunit E [Thermoplasmata archaeon]